MAQRSGLMSDATQSWIWKYQNIQGSVQKELPKRLLHVPSMTSVELDPSKCVRADGIPTYNEQTKYNILSYTWGRWLSQKNEAVAIKGTTWSIPAVTQKHFLPQDFQKVLQKVAEGVDFVWVDVACINQGWSLEDVTKRMDQIGRQMGIFAGAVEAYVWPANSDEFVIQVCLQRFNRSLATAWESSFNVKENPRSVTLADAAIGHKINKNQSIICQCINDMHKSSRILHSNPWFSSLWTLQESVLRRKAIILSREGLLPPVGNKKKALTLHIVRNGFMNCLLYLSELLERYHLSLSPATENAILELKAKIESNVLAFMECRNPNLAYSLARYRQCSEKQLEDRIYGIMQVYGFRLGKAMAPESDFSLEELQAQFSRHLNENLPLFGQLFVHRDTPLPG